MTSATPVCQTVENLHYPELASYLQVSWVQGDTVYWVDRFRTWWELNPTFSPNMPRGFILRDGAGQIVGFIGNIPFLIQIRHKPQTVIISTSWFTNSEYRSGTIGLKLLLEQMRSARNTVLLTDTASRVTGHVMERLRFRRIPSTAARQSFYLGNPCQVLHGHLQGRNIPRACFWIGGRVVKLLQEIRIHLPDCKGFLVKELSSCGEEFDELWERSKARFGTTAVRSRAQLQWYCFCTPSLKKAVFGAYTGERLVAYLVLGFRGSYGYQTWECMDYWEDGQGSAAVALVCHAIRWARSHKVVALQFSHLDPALSLALRRLRLFSRAVDPAPLYYLEGNSEQSDPFSEDAYLSRIVGDRGL